MKNILLTTLFLFFFTTVYSQITITEIDVTQSGNDSDEFVELSGPANSSLNGYVLLLLDGSSDDIYDCQDLSGFSFDSDGAFTIGNADNLTVELTASNSNNWLKDGTGQAYAVAIVQMNGCPGNNADCSSLNNIIDAVVYDTDAPDDNDLMTCLGVAAQCNENENNTAGSQSLQLNMGCDGVANPTPGVLPVGALPVELTTFKSKVLDNNSILLFWQTASEENNSHFEIEHSRDGQRFKKVGQKTGMGTTTNPHMYNMRHERLSKGFHYYRLKQVDFDGKYEYSNIVSAKLKLTLDDVSIAPNPAMEKVTIFIDTPISIAASYQLVNMQKEVMIEKTIDVGNSSFEIDMTNLPGGVYFMRFYVDQQVVSKKIVKLY